MKVQTNHHKKAQMKPNRQQLLQNKK